MMDGLALVLLSYSRNSRSRFTTSWDSFSWGDTVGETKSIWFCKHFSSYSINLIICEISYFVFILLLFHYSLRCRNEFFGRYWLKFKGGFSFAYFCSLWWHKILDSLSKVHWLPLIFLMFWKFSIALWSCTRPSFPKGSLQDDCVSLWSSDSMMT